MHFFNTGHTEMSRSDVYLDKGIAGIIPATRFWKRNMGIPAISRISHSLVVFLSHVHVFRNTARCIYMFLSSGVLTQNMNDKNNPNRVYIRETFM